MLAPTIRETFGMTNKGEPKILSINVADVAGAITLAKDRANDSLFCEHQRPGVAFVDGLGVGDVQDVALRDRRRLSEDGVLIIVATLASTNGGSAGPPELIARGFGDDSGPLLDELRDEANRVLQQCLREEISEIKLLQEHLHDEVGQLVYDRTHRRPMILPVVVEV